MKSIQEHFVKKSSARVGVFVCDTSVKIAEIETDDLGSFRVVGTGEAMLDEGIVRHGKILNADRLVETLQGLVNGKEKFSIHEVSVALPDSLTYFHVFSFPGNLSDLDVKNALRFQFEEVFPLPYADAVIDFAVVARSVEATVVSCATTAKAAVKQYEEIFTRAGLKIVGLALEADALQRSQLSETREAKVELLVNVKKDAYALALVNAYGLYASFRPILSEEDDASASSRIKFLAQKISEIADWYERTAPAGGSVNELILCGDVSHADTMKEDLEGYLKGDLSGITVRIGELGKQTLQTVPAKTQSRGKNEKTLAPYTVAIGAAFQGLVRRTRPFELLESAQKGQYKLATDGRITAMKSRDSFTVKNVHAYVDTIPERTRILVSLVFIGVAIIIFIGAIVWYERGVHRADRETADLRSSLLQTASSTPMSQKK